MKAELLFWIENIHRVNEQSFQRTLIHQVFDIDFETDASKKAARQLSQLLPPLMTLEALYTALHSDIRIWVPAISDEVIFPMVRYWRTLGILVIKFADDFPNAA